MKTLISALFLVLIGVVVSGQPPAKPQGGFVPIDQLPAAESFPAAPLLIAAYAVAWVAVFLYVWSVWRRLNHVERELRDVTRRVEAGRRP
jgi:CcmD family protein